MIHYWKLGFYIVFKESCYKNFLMLGYIEHLLNCYCSENLRFSMQMWHITVHIKCVRKPIISVDGYVLSLTINYFSIKWFIPCNIKWKFKIFLTIDINLLLFFWFHNKINIGKFNVGFLELIRYWILNFIFRLPCKNMLDAWL